ncbi:MAG: T9SS type A sorting domain-containing protein [candidate division Zixibacteria bacterium]|nr:T9SS type A sorting domain-containing protein [candidate division Zixibacteria bacterium]
MMKKTILALLIMPALLFVTASAQDVIWENTFANADSCYDHGNCVDLTSDGGYIIAGNTQKRTTPDTSNSDVYLVKVDDTGSVMWSTTFDLMGDDDVSSCVKETSDGGYIITGRVLYGGVTDLYFLKTNSTGAMQWMTNYGIGGGNAGLSVDQTDDGGYIATGYSATQDSADNVYVVRVDPNGNLMWHYRFGGLLDDWGTSVSQNSDGGFHIAGWTASFGAGYEDVYLIKLDGAGNILWTNTYGGSGNDAGTSSKETLDGGFIIGGYTESYGSGLQDAYLVKADGGGAFVWHNFFGTASSERAASVEATADGGYVMTGYTNSTGYNQLTVIKTDGNGALDWDSTYGGPGNEWGSCIKQTYYCSYVVVGSTDSYGLASWDTDVYLLNVESGYGPCEMEVLTPYVPNVNGVIQWDLTVRNCGWKTRDFYGELYPTRGGCMGTQIDMNLNRLVYSALTGKNTFTGSYFYAVPPVPGIAGLNAITIKAGPAVDDWYGECCDEFFFYQEWARGGNGQANWYEGQWLDREDETGITAEQPSLGCNYPNPFNAVTSIPFELSESGNVTLIVYNLAGQVVESLVDGYMDAGQHAAVWDASAVASGVYFYKLETGDYTTARKMNLVK